MPYAIDTIKRSPVGISETMKCRCGLPWGWQTCIDVMSVAMGLGFKVLGSVGNFSVICGENPSLSVPRIPDLPPLQVFAFTAPRVSALFVMSTRANLKVLATCVSLGEAEGIDIGLCCGGLSSVLYGPPGFVLLPARSHSQYGQFTVVPS